MGDIKIDKLKAELLAEEFPQRQIQVSYEQGRDGRNILNSAGEAKSECDAEGPGYRG